MKINIATRNISLTDKVRDMVESELGKLEKFLPEDADANVTLKGKKNYAKVEMTIPMKRYTLRVEEEDRDLAAAIDRVRDVMERQIRKYKTKLARHNRQDFKPAFMEAEDAHDEEIDIIRTKKFAVKPMTPEEAVLQMNLLSHQFFAFRNAETGNIGVVYLRTDGSYGVIDCVD